MKQNKTKQTSTRTDDKRTEEAKRIGGRVLVHCVAGVSRSATMVVGYLMHSTGASLNEAMRFVRKRRFIEPNEGFMMQLAELEETEEERYLVLPCGFKHNGARKGD